MATFTRLTPAQVAAIADAFELGSVSDVRPIAAGTINSNYDVTTERGRFFVRVNEGKSEDDVAWEAQLVAELAERGVTTPPPLPARDGRRYAPLPARDGSTHARLGSKLVSAFAWRDGDHLGEAEVTPVHARAFGAALAQLHVAGLALPEAWRRESIYAHAHLVARFRGFAGSSDPQLARAIAILGEELAAADDPARAAATRGIIHGDLFRDNVLWRDHSIAAILDFEQASGGSLAYDLAVCINDWCWSGGPRIDVATALVAGYQSVRELTPTDRAALPIELRASAARFTITRITDVYLAKVANPEKDFRAFLARCEAWRSPVLGQLTASL